MSLSSSSPRTRRHQRHIRPARHPNVNATSSKTNQTLEDSHNTSISLTRSTTLKTALSYRAFASSASAYLGSKQKGKDTELAKIPAEAHRDPSNPYLGEPLGGAGLRAEEDGDLPLPVVCLHLALHLHRQGLRRLDRAARLPAERRPPEEDEGAPDEDGDRGGEDHGQPSLRRRPIAACEDRGEEIERRGLHLLRSHRRARGASRSGDATQDNPTMDRELPLSLPPTLGIASSSWVAEREGGVGGIAEEKGGFIDDLSLTKPPTRLPGHLPRPVTMVKIETLRRTAQSPRTSVGVDVVSRLWDPCVRTPRHPGKSLSRFNPNNRTARKFCSRCQGCGTNGLESEVFSAEGWESVMYCCDRWRGRCI